MFTKTHLRHNFLILPALIVATAVLLSGFLIIQARAESSADANASISFKKDPVSGLFVITISDPQGIQEFSLKPPQKFSYGGLVGGCLKTRKIDNVSFADPDDFTPKMDGYVVDCNDSRTEFEIPPPKNGVTTGVRLLKPKSAEEAPAPAPAPQGGVSAPSTAEAPKAVKITYPVAELGNCKSEAECRTYCDRPANLEKCVAFAESHNLMTVAEATQAKKFKELLAGGDTPGGCDSKTGCETYCNDVTNIDACLAFGEKSGFLSGKELAEAKKIRAAVKGGAKLPGDCRNKTACESYCKNSQHAEECLAFARQSGFLNDEELREAEKFLPLMQRGETPGACKSKEECESYCEAENNMDECFDFAKKHDLVSEEDVKRFEQFKKAGGVGPGGCKGRQCESFCEKPENQKTCFAWAKENGFLEEQDLRRMEEGRQQLRGALEQAPPEAKACIEEAIPGGIAAMESGEFFGGPEIGDKIRGCFESAFSQFGGPPGEFPGVPGEFPGGGATGGQFPGGGPPGNGGFGGGPGGCKSIDECMAYCQEHLDECGGLGPPGGSGGFPGERRDFKGPRNTEECAKQGGSWDGSKCNFRDQSMENIGIDRGGEECVKQGGNWNGKNCNFPQQQYQQQSPGAEESLRRIQENPIEKLREGFQPPTGVMPPGDFGAPPTGNVPSPEQFQQQYQQQFQQEYQKQMEQQIQQQYQQQYEQQYQQQYQQQMEQQYQQQYQQQIPQQYQLPPTEIAPTPSGSLEKPSLLARLLNLFK